MMLFSPKYVILKKNVRLQTDLVKNIFVHKLFLKKIPKEEISVGNDIKCLLLLLVVAVFFITEIIPLAVTATAGAIACGVLGFIPVKQVFSGLSNSTVVLFAGMFVVGAAMFYTGLAQKIGQGVVKLSGTGENSLMFGIMLVGCILSSVLSNTGTAACLLPVVLGICAAAKVPASRELMPLAFACGIDRKSTRLNSSHQ